MPVIKYLIFALILAGCNSVYVKPNTLEPGGTVYARYGGYTMRRSIKQQMEKRGYKVLVGKARTDDEWEDDNVGIEVIRVEIPSNAKYLIRVHERREMFNPFWCPFNGFWWWNFNVSIANQKTGEEIMTWRGRGCADSSLRKLDKILDTLEIKNEQ